MTDSVEINIKLPLPLDIAATLMKLIGAAYPSARVKNHGGTEGSHLTFLINLEDRVPDGDVEAFLESFTPELMDPEVGESRLTETGVTPPQWLATVAAAMMNEVIADAPNYVEAPIVLENGEGIIMTVARSREQTPHELRLRVEERVRALEDKLREVGVDPSTI